MCGAEHLGKKINTVKEREREREIGFVRRRVGLGFSLYKENWERDAEAEKLLGRFIKKLFFKTFEILEEILRILRGGEKEIPHRSRILSFRTFPSNFSLSHIFCVFYNIFAPKRARKDYTNILLFLLPTMLSTIKCLEYWVGLVLVAFTAFQI